LKRFEDWDKISGRKNNTNLKLKLIKMPKYTKTQIKKEKYIFKNFKDFQLET